MEIVSCPNPGTQIHSLAFLFIIRREKFPTLHPAMVAFSERQDTVQAIQGKPNPNTAVCGPVTLALLGLGRFVNWQEHFMSQMTGVYRDMLAHVQPNQTVRKFLLLPWSLLKTDLRASQSVLRNQQELRALDPGNLSFFLIPKISGNCGNGGENECGSVHITEVGGEIGMGKLFPHLLGRSFALPR